MFSGDQLAVATATGQFVDALSGQAKTVRISGLSLGGADAQNYRLLDSTALTTADISLPTSEVYLQATQLTRLPTLPDTRNALKPIDIETILDGVNTSDIQTLEGEY